MGRCTRAKIRSLLSMYTGISSNVLPWALTIGPKNSFSQTTRSTLGGKSASSEVNPFTVSSMAGPPVMTVWTTG